MTEVVFSFAVVENFRGKLCLVIESAISKQSMQWLWLSWQSGPFEHYLSTVRIHSLEIFT